MFNQILFSQTFGSKIGVTATGNPFFWVNKCMVLDLKSGPSVLLSSNGISVPLQS